MPTSHLAPPVLNDLDLESVAAGMLKARPAFFLPDTPPGLDPRRLDSPQSRFLPRQLPRFTPMPGPDSTPEVLPQPRPK